MGWQSKRGKQNGPSKWRKAKVVVEFDAEARREFLTGFQKRKAERRKIAENNIIRKEAEERKKEKKERREEMKQIIAKFEQDNEIGKLIAG